MFFIIWGSDWKYKEKGDGLVVDKFCPNCHRQGKFFEVVPTKYFTIFWIPLFPQETKNSLLECPNCQERFYIQESDYYSGIKNKNKDTAIEMPNREDIFVLERENCGQKLRVPLKEKIIVVTCPKCKNSFKARNGRKIINV